MRIIFRPESPNGVLANCCRGGIKDIPTLIKEGFDPIHAVYVFMQNMTAYFAEGVAQMSEMKAWARAVEMAEDEYMPSGPPMSPLTGSFFWMWAFYDLQIGKSTDTLAYCQIAANDVIQMNVHQLDALKKMNGSRMGVYEHIGMEGPHILLRELITEDQFSVHCPAGYRGRKGELWYVRLVPPLEPQLAIYWIAMTTPYILPRASKSDWIAFLKRTMVQCEGPIPWDWLWQIRANLSDLPPRGHRQDQGKSVPTGRRYSGDRLQDSG